MTPEELASEILKLSEEDRKKLRLIVLEETEKAGIDICPVCWSNGGTWCCADEPKDW